MLPVRPTERSLFVSSRAVLCIARMSLPASSSVTSDPRRLRPASRRPRMSVPARTQVCSLAFTSSPTMEPRDA
ncbi:hypothetical protein D3C71_1001630 [compost metagenome]